MKVPTKPVEVTSEQEVVALLRAFLRDNSDALHSVARWGDGKGGFLFEVIRDELGITDDDSTTIRKKDKIPRTLAKQVFERDAYRCMSCGGHIDLCCDHVVPESKGGEAVFDNLQTLCRPCNSRKGIKSASEWGAN